MEGTRYLRAPETYRTLMQGPIGAILLLEPEASEGRFSLVEHPLAARALGAPVHTHRNEDEYSFVLVGTVGFEIDGRAFEATAGSLVLKPRSVPHAFWNPTDEPARVLELIVPGGFEGYFADLGEILALPGPPDPGALQQVASRYELDLDSASIPRLAAEHGLDVGAPPDQPAS
jgi:mannose-6-phosphate isomerase-like protein (cupin superfamily)